MADEVSPGKRPHGQFLRGNSPVMLAWTGTGCCCGKGCPATSDYECPQRFAGVILWQLENEYN